MAMRDGAAASSLLLFVRLCRLFFRQRFQAAFHVCSARARASRQVSVLRPRGVPLRVLAVLLDRLSFIWQNRGDSSL